MEPRRKGVESDVEDTQRGQYQTELQQVLFRGFMAFEQSGELSRFGVGVELSAQRGGAVLRLLAGSYELDGERGGLLWPDRWLCWGSLVSLR